MSEGGVPSLRLGGFTDMSTVDWYGNVSLVAFFAGCNLRCPYCQNPELIPTRSGEDVRFEDFCRRIEINLNLLDAVVFTGGEPLLQPDGIEEAAEIVREFGLRLMLDTNGSRPEVVERLLEAGLVDRVALDVKAPISLEDYGKVIGIPRLGAEIAEAVECTLEICKSQGAEVEARTTVAPTVSDDPEFIRRIASKIKGMCDVYYLQQFDNTGDVLSPLLRELKPPDKETMTLLAEAALEEGVENVYIKTRKFGLERIG